MSFHDECNNVRGGPTPPDAQTSKSGMAHEIGQTIREAIDWPKILRLSWLMVAIAISYDLLSR